jgi:putative transposase
VPFFLILIADNCILYLMFSRYRKNAGAVFSLKYHLVWCPKYRRSVLVGKVAKRLESLLKAKCRELEMTVHTLRVMPDHVHIFVESDTRWSVSEITNRLKGSTSHQLREEFPFLKSRLPSLWSRSYYAGTVGSVSEETVKHYIESQKGK